jgi:transposase
MMIIGCDLHTRYQQIAMLDTETGELVERRLEHESGEARAFYTALAGGVRVGIEATGHTHWFEAMLAELGHELWMGDAAKIRAAVVRKQKTDARDAAHLLDMLSSDRFPRIWRPSGEERDLRQLVWHRQKLVWMRGAVKNQMHALAMGEGVCRKKKLFTAKGRQELEGLALGP